MTLPFGAHHRNHDRSWQELKEVSKEHAVIRGHNGNPYRCGL